MCILSVDRDAPVLSATVKAATTDCPTKKDTKRTDEVVSTIGGDEDMKERHAEEDGASMPHVEEVTKTTHEEVEEAPMQNKEEEDAKERHAEEDEAKK